MSKKSKIGSNPSIFSPKIDGHLNAIRMGVIQKRQKQYGLVRKDVPEAEKNLIVVRPSGNGSGVVGGWCANLPHNASGYIAEERRDKEGNIIPVLIRTDIRASQRRMFMTDQFIVDLMSQRK